MKHENLLHTRISFFISRVGKTENIHEFEMEIFK